MTVVPFWLQKMTNSGVWNKVAKMMVEHGGKWYSLRRCIWCVAFHKLVSIDTICVIIPATSLLQLFWKSCACVATVRNQSWLLFRRACRLWSVLASFAFSTSWNKRSTKLKRKTSAERVFFQKLSSFSWALCQLWLWVVTPSMLGRLYVAKEINTWGTCSSSG